jgi:hypothetical protein
MYFKYLVNVQHSYPQSYQQSYAESIAGSVVPTLASCLTTTSFAIINAIDPLAAAQAALDDSRISRFCRPAAASGRAAGATSAPHALAPPQKSPGAAASATAWAAPNSFR